MLRLNGKEIHKFQLTEQHHKWNHDHGLSNIPITNKYTWRKKKKIFSNRQMPCYLNHLLCIQFTVNYRFTENQSNAFHFKLLNFFCWFPFFSNNLTQLFEHFFSNFSIFYMWDLFRTIKKKTEQIYKWWLCSKKKPHTWLKWKLNTKTLCVCFYHKMLATIGDLVSHTNCPKFLECQQLHTHNFSLQNCNPVFEYSKYSISNV